MITKNGKKKTKTHKANLGLNYLSAVFLLAERDRIGFLGNSSMHC